ncbi:MAG: leucine-rich repeat protein [Clostridia bacterium]|nr:leucine-rich repeat protein [Clostridia bacterium]
MIKRITALISVFALAASQFVYVYAQSNSCGENAQWNYEDGTLIISGKGKISDFEGGQDRPWEEFSQNVTKIVIEDGITEIGDWAFSDFSGLVQTDMPQTLKTIGERAFYNCGSISYINLPYGVEVIEDGAFNSCINAVRVDLPQSLKKIGNSAFMNLPELTAVEIPEYTEEIGKWAFFGCSSLKGIYFEGNVPEKIGSYMIANIDEDYMVYFNKSYSAQWKEKNIFSSDHTYIYDKKSIIPLYVNNRRVNFDQQPIIRDGRTLVPVRAIFEAMGAVVGWDSETRTVVAERNSTIIKIGIDNTIMYKNDVPITIDVPAVIENSRTLVPARAICEAFGADVKWNNSERTVYITTND